MSSLQPESCRQARLKMIKITTLYFACGPTNTAPEKSIIHLDLLRKKFGKLIRIFF